MSKFDVISIASKVLDYEIRGLSELRESLNNNFVKIVNTIFQTKGRVIVTGMGKSGHVARKIVATLASTGTPATFVHPGEASHGDLGMITKEDIVILLSNSGETKELKDIVYYTKRFAISSISIVRKENSSLSSLTDYEIKIPESPEAVSYDAPTTSTTMMMALGDVIAVCLSEMKNFKKEDFGIFHPGGRLGASFVKVTDLMHKDEEIPLCSPENDFKTVTKMINEKKLGCAIILNSKRQAVGIVTDGDLRRAILENKTNLKAIDFATLNPATILANSLAVEALDIMNNKLITNIIVVNGKQEVIGLLHIHDCLKAGVSPMM
jgi:arabinose-5-phosphate isomerase